MRTKTCLVLLAAVLAMSAAAAGQSAKPAQAAYTQVLDAPSMDKTVDPCVDFFTFSCGGWIKNNPIPADQSSWDAYGKLQEENRQVLRQILEAAAVPSPKRSAEEQKIGDYYASCMDEAAIEKLGATPLKPDLDRIARLKSKADLPGELAHLHPNDVGSFLGRASLFSFGSNQDAKNSTEFIAEVDQGGIGLPDRDFYFKDDPKSEEIRKQYLAHVQKMFVLLGDKPNDAAAEAQTVMRIETDLAKASLTRVERRDPNKVYHKLTREELQALSPSFSWDRYFAEIGLPGTKSLNVAVPEFVKGMDAELKSEDLASWKVYLRWHLVHAQARYLSTAFVNEDFDFYDHILAGTKEIQPRWKRCVRFVDRQLGEALGKVYVQKTFSPETKQRALVMVKQIEAAMGSEIQQLPWMSPATKEQAQAKLHTVVNKIGYPDRWRDYSTLDVVRGDALENGERGAAFEFRRWLNKIGRPLDRGEWYMTPPTVNAYYNPQMNDINFPAGVLQPPLFDPRSDDAPNYGNTGGTIGHELTHGFDDEGRQFDAQGNLRDWWTAEDAKEFEKRASCTSDQYSQYVIVDDIKINGKLTLGEDVADLGGLLLAYLAWQDANKGKDLQPIDGFTPEQRFFIGYGQSWCSLERPEVQRLRATVDPHSPPRYRTNGVVSNMPEFQKAFSCKAGAPMVRENRCRIW
ncbi:MAG TPA: M13 family metallopeptidase [Terriglobales bacterium]|nr:M13 family metallopeptidase [Terriglobales bacterium]